VSVSIQFVSEGQITQPLTVVVEQVVTERNVSLLVTNEADNGHYDALLPEKRYF
jgi:hypothetical protein